MCPNLHSRCALHSVETVPSLRSKLPELRAMLADATFFRGFFVYAARHRLEPSRGFELLPPAMSCGGGIHSTRLLVSIHPLLVSAALPGGCLTSAKALRVGRWRWTWQRKPSSSSCPRKSSRTCAYGPLFSRCCAATAVRNSATQTWPATHPHLIRCCLYVALNHLIKAL